VVNVKERMRELQAAMPGLSQEMAFQEAVIEGLKEQADKLGDGMADVTIEQDKLRARIRGFKEDVGQGVNDVLEGAAAAAFSLWDGLTLLTGSTWKIVVTGEGSGFDFMLRVVEGSEKPFDPTLWNWEDFMPAYMTGATGRLPAQQRAPEIRHVLTPEAANIIAGLGQIDPQSWQSMLENQYMPMRRVLGGGAGIPTGRGTELSIAEQLYRESLMRLGIIHRAIDWTAAGPRGIASLMRGGVSPGFGLIDPEAQRQQQMEIEKFQRYAAGMQKASGGIDWERAFAAMQPPSMEGVVGRGLSFLTDEKAAASAEKTAQSLERSAQAASSLATEADRAGKSLEQLWGLDPTTFGESVYQHGTSALREYGVEAEKAEEAQRYLGITTGTTNAQSEIFRLRMQGAAEQLERNTLSTAGYAIQVGLLADEDWSWVDRLLRTPTDEEGLRRYVELLGKIASGEYGQGAGVVPDQIAEQQRRMGLGTVAAGDIDPFTRITDLAILAEAKYQEMTAASETSWSEMGLHVTQWQNLATGEVKTLGTESGLTIEEMKAASETQWTEMGEDVTTFSEEATVAITRWGGSFVSELETVEQRLRALTDRSWTVTITSRFGERTPEEFQHGGYTGDGAPWQVAGIVHKGEYVISQDVLRKMKQGQDVPAFPRVPPMLSGGGGGGVTISGPVHLHGVQNPQQLFEALQREAGRRNLSMASRA
jgi:hypothetical protein